MFLLAVENFVKLISVGIVCHSLIFLLQFKDFLKTSLIFLIPLSHFTNNVIFIIFRWYNFVLLTDYLALQITQNK